MITRVVKIKRMTVSLPLYLNFLKNYVRIQQKETLGNLLRKPHRTVHESRICII